VGAGTIVVGAPVLGLDPGLGHALDLGPGHVLGPARGPAQDRGPARAQARPPAGITATTARSPAPGRVRGIRKEKEGAMATTAEAVQFAGAIGALALVLLVVMVAMLSVVELTVVRMDPSGVVVVA